MLIAAAGSRTGASRAILMLAEIGLVQLVVSRYVLDECERNLRLKLPAGLPVFAELLSVARVEIIEDPPDQDVAPYLALIEPGDAPILAAARAAGVHQLVTLNSRDFTPAVSQATGLDIRTPGEFIAALRELIDGT